MKRTWSSLVAAIMIASLAWAGETAATTLKIAGMTSDGCVSPINAELKKTDGVVAYEVSFETGEAVVSYNPAQTTPTKIAESVARAGYAAFVKGSAVGAVTTSACASGATTSTAKSDVALERVTLFQVPLMCPAVKGLGCGSKARPFMAELEERAGVAEAWLNHPGTVLAIVWKEPQKHEQAISLVGSLFQTKGLSVTPLDGASLNDALQDFAARTQWYRGQDVNRLSEMEGAVFKERMAKRIEARTKLSPASAAALRADLARFCVDMLLGRGGRDTKPLLEELLPWREFLYILEQRHTEKVRYAAREVKAVLFVEPDRPPERVRCIKTHARAASILKFAFSSIQQLPSYAGSLPPRKHRHPAKMTFALPGHLK